MAEVTKWRQYWWIWPWFVFIAITVAAYLALAPYKVVVPDKLELIAQLRAGEYQALEDYLTNLQDHFETGEVPERNVSIGFNAFGNSGRDVEGHLNDWVKQLPQSCDILLLQKIMDFYLPLELSIHFVNQRNRE